MIDVFAVHGYLPAAAEQSGEGTENWADRLAGAIANWIIDALAERLALALIGALA